MSVMLCMGATFVKTNSCPVAIARIVSLDTAGLYLLTFLVLEPCPSQPRPSQSRYLTLMTFL